jgi:hypothetical protein
VRDQAAHGYVRHDDFVKFTDIKAPDPAHAARALAATLKGDPLAPDR